MSRSRRWVYGGPETFRSKRKASMRTDVPSGTWLPGWGQVERRIIAGQRRAARKRQARRDIDEE